jgi:hypothetical protein
LPHDRRRTRGAGRRHRVRARFCDETRRAWRKRVYM